MPTSGCPPTTRRRADRHWARGSGPWARFGGRDGCRRNWRKNWPVWGWFGTMRLLLLLLRAKNQHRRRYRHRPPRVFLSSTSIAALAETGATRDRPNATAREVYIYRTFIIRQNTHGFVLGMGMDRHRLSRTGHRGPRSLPTRPVGSFRRLQGQHRPVRIIHSTIKSLLLRDLIQTLVLLIIIQSATTTMTTTVSFPCPIPSMTTTTRIGIPICTKPMHLRQ